MMGASPARRRRLLVALAIGLARLGVRTGGPAVMLALNTPVVSALKPTIMGIVTFAVPLAIVVHILSLWQLIVG